jgi:Patatin-like phospholipase
VVILACALLSSARVPARATPPGATADAVRAVLEQTADHHAASASIARGPAWDALTVRRLVAYLHGDVSAASEADVALLRDELERPAALIVSGAVSMGNYQGGFLYYYLRHLQAARQLAVRVGSRRGETWTPAIDSGSPIGLITGSSSGSINAFVAAISSCQDLVRDPHESLFWKVWLPVGARQLQSNEQVQPDGLLSTVAVEDAVHLVQSEWEAGRWSSHESCSVDVGLSATRLQARTVMPFDGAHMKLRRQTEKLMFSMRGAAGEAPRLTPFVPPEAAAADGVLGKLFPRIGPPGRDMQVRDVLDVLQASSAFSFAFPPHHLSLSTGDVPSRLDDGLFTDGGVFDNRPVGMALLMQRWRLGEAGAAAARTRYIVQDPDVVAWTPGRPAASAPPLDALAPAPSTGARPRNFLDTWQSFTEDFLATAFEVELTDVIEREAGLATSLEVPPRRVPVAGAYLMEFLSFAERDFRVFDFFTGMVDAWRQLAETSLVFQVLAQTGPIEFDGKAPEFDCLLAWRTHQLTNSGPPPPGACGALDHADPILRRNLEALVNASAVTLAFSTRPTPRPQDPSDEATFMRALGGTAATAAYQFRELEYRGQPATPETLPLAIRDVMQVIIERTTFNQTDGISRFAVGGVGKAAVNYYAYRPPMVFVGAGMLSDRGFEVQGGWRLPWNHHTLPLTDLRLDAVVRARAIHVGDDGDPATANDVLQATYMAAAHLTDELQLGRFAPSLQSLLQIHLGVGWAIESERRWDLHAIAWRHGPEAIVGATLFQRLYFEASADIYRGEHVNGCDPAGSVCGASEAGVGGAAPRQAHASWALRFALGYRLFLD